jgi:hypothetical protein
MVKIVLPSFHPINIPLLLTDKAVTSATGLTLIRECRCRIDTDDYRKNADAGLTLFLAFLHLLKGTVL